MTSALILLLLLLQAPPANTEKQGKQAVEDTNNPDAPSNPSKTITTIQGPVKIEGPIEIQDKTQQQPKSVIGVLLSPDHVFDWLIVLIGFAATIAALRNLKHLRQQTTDLTEQTRAMKEANELTKTQMEAALAPRLSIDRMWVKNLLVGKAAAAFIEVKNSGQTDATDVAIDIRVHVGDDVSYYTDSPHRIMIPAKSTRLHYIKSQHILSGTTWQAMNSGDGSYFRVTGYVEFDGRREDFCYKFHRNELLIPDIPKFVPCDFATRRIVTAHAYGAIKFTARADLTAGPDSPHDKEEPEKG